MRRFWAVARVTFLECLRTRVVIVFLVLLAVCVLAMALTMEGDGTLKGRIQTFLAYSTGLTQLLLSLVTVLLATGVVAGDIRHKYVLIVVSKPLPRWQYVLGRWVGIALLDAVLVGLAMGSIYGLSQYLRARQTNVEQKKLLGQLPQRAGDLDRLAVDSEVFTARTMKQAEPFDVGDQVEVRFRRLVEERRLDAVIESRIRRELESERVKSRSEDPLDVKEIERRLQDARTRQRMVVEIKADLKKEAVEERQLVVPGEGLTLTFKGLKPPKGWKEPLQLRYRLHPMHTPESRTLKSFWNVFNPKTGEGRLPWNFKDDSAEAVSSFLFSPKAVAEDGELKVEYWNVPRPGFITSVKVKAEEVNVLYRVGSFEGNVVRAGVLILLGLMFLAAAGVLFAVFLSFPIACLACMIVFAIAMMSGFIHDATRLNTQTEKEPTAMDYFSHGVTQVAFFFLPSLSESSPGAALVDGMNIPFRQVLRESLVMIQRPGDDSTGLWRKLGFEVQAGAGLRAWLCLGLGCLIFWRRELARVQV